MPLTCRLGASSEQERMLFLTGDTDILDTIRPVILRKVKTKTKSCWILSPTLHCPHHQNSCCRPPAWPRSCLCIDIPSQITHNRRAPHSKEGPPPRSWRNAALVDAGWIAAARHTADSCGPRAPAVCFSQRRLNACLWIYGSVTSAMVPLPLLCAREVVEGVFDVFQRGFTSPMGETTCYTPAARVFVFALAHLTGQTHVALEPFALLVSIKT